MAQETATIEAVITVKGFSRAKLAPGDEYMNFTVEGAPGMDPPTVAIVCWKPYLFEHLIDAQQSATPVCVTMEPQKNGYLHVIAIEGVTPPIVSEPTALRTSSTDGQKTKMPTSLLTPGSKPIRVDITQGAEPRGRDGAGPVRRGEAGTLS